MSKSDKITMLAHQIDMSYRNLFLYDHGLDIRDHIFVSADVSDSLAETLVESLGDDCFVSIRFSKDLAQTVDAHTSPFEKLQTNNLSAFSIVAEEVSHFHEICKAATFETPISRFDLELQSEFDKFILAITLMKEQSGRAHSAPLARLLFDSTYNYLGDELYDVTENIAAGWWWHQIHRYGDQVLNRPEVWQSLYKIRSLNGHAKLAFISESRSLKLTA